MQLEAVTGLARSGRYRWLICALLFLATVVNYMDRQILGLLAPMLQADIGWTQLEYSRIVTAFTAAYAVGLLLAGRFIDTVGVRLAYTGAMLFWSIAAMLHAAVSSVAGFAVVRALLGLGEGGNFPAAIKSTAEWFPRSERALATGLFNSGANVGAIVAPAIIPALALALGWRMAFVLIGALGLLWVPLWWSTCRPVAQHPRVSPAERAFILQDDDTVVEEVAPAAPSWRAVLRHRQVWAFMVGKFLTDPVWWFYLFWLPKWLAEERGIDMKGLGLPLVVIYLIATVGSIAGGWLSSRLLRRGATVNRARKTAMLVCALCVLPIVTVSGLHELWLAVPVIGLAAAAHQGWSANLFTTVSDQFPRHAIATVVGLGGMAGSLGAVLFSEVIGRVLEQTGTYWALFAIGGSAYLIALSIFHWLVPRMAPVDLAR
ncbi:MAG TPA: MFS transporter [Lysobacter sp.]